MQNGLTTVSRCLTNGADGFCVPALPADSVPVCLPGYVGCVQHELTISYIHILIIYRMLCGKPPACLSHTTLAGRRLITSGFALCFYIGQIFVCLTDAAISSIVIYYLLSLLYAINGWHFIFGQSCFSRFLLACVCLILLVCPGVCGRAWRSF